MTSAAAPADFVGCTIKDDSGRVGVVEAVDSDDDCVVAWEGGINARQRTISMAKVQRMLEFVGKTLTSDKGVTGVVETIDSGDDCVVTWAGGKKEAVSKRKASRLMNKPHPAAAAAAPAAAALAAATTAEPASPAPPAWHGGCWLPHSCSVTVA